MALNSFDIKVDASRYVSSLQRTVPAAGYTSGQALLLQDVLAFVFADEIVAPSNAVPANHKAALISQCDCMQIAKDSVAIAQGDKVYWTWTSQSAGTGKVTNSPSTGDILCGYCTKDGGSASGDSDTEIYFDGGLFTTA